MSAEMKSSGSWKTKRPFKEEKLFKKRYFSSNIKIVSNIQISTARCQVFNSITVTLSFKCQFSCVAMLLSHLCEACNCNNTVVVIIILIF